MRIDRYDRPSVPHNAASYECLAVGGRLPDQGEFQELIHAGVSGSSNWLHTGESMYWYNGGFGYAMARWSTVETGWFWAGTPSTGSVTAGTSKLQFRCVFSDRLD